MACAVLVLGSLLPGAATAQIEQTPRIIDGATLETAGRRFRLHGIVAPALDQVCQRRGRPYPCGQVARAALWDLVGGREVSCTPVAGESADRPAAATCSAAGASLNEAMVASGWALAERAAGDTYVPLEQAAAQAGRGLWSGEFALAGTVHPVAE